MSDTQAQSAAPATQNAADDNSVTLDFPITRGEQTITKITLRKPRSGELRGTSLNALVNLDINALRLVLPRISTPMLTDRDVDQLDPADLTQLGGVFAGFLLPKAMQANTDSPTT